MLNKILKIAGCSCCVFLIVLIAAKPDIYLKSAGEGIKLWALTVVPSLLPFFFLSSLSSALGFTSFLSRFPPAGGMRLRFRRKHRIRIPRRSEDRRRLKRKRIYHRRRGYESGRAVFVFRSVVRHRLRRRGRVRQFLRRLRSAFIAYTVRNRLRTCFQILRRIRT